MQTAKPLVTVNKNCATVLLSTAQSPIADQFFYSFFIKLCCKLVNSSITGLFAVDLATNCNIGSKRVFCHLASDVEM